MGGSFLTESSVLYDAVYVPGGDASVQALMKLDEAQEFISEAFKHCKAIAATGAGTELLVAALGKKLGNAKVAGNKVSVDQGVVSSSDAATKNVATAFIDAIKQHRHWEREDSRQ